jgi:signal transduction histidine kinase
VDTLVSEPVAAQVLGEGRPFNGRAWVVNRWVNTCYLPLENSAGEVVGMLYAGIDEERHLARARAALYTFIGVILAITGVISVVAIGLGRRLTRPLTELTSASRALAEGHFEAGGKPPSSPEEIRILSESFHAMADRVVRRTKALEESRAEAREALESYLEVLAFVAHELKSPVAGALTALDLIEQGYVGEVPEKMRPTLSKLHRYLGRGLEMAVNFTYLSRAESRGFEVTRAPIASLREEILEPAIADFEDEVEWSGMPVELSGDAPLSGDAQLLRIVFDNLIGNAVKYGKAGTSIGVRVSSDEGKVRVAVRNHGVGIEERHHARIFEKFSRVDDRQLRGRKGSGVGLYLSRLIAELHGGGISVSGVYGEWVEFTVELPV